MSSYKTAAVLSVVFAISACGFRPLYAPPAEDASGERVYAFDALKTVDVGQIPDRNGQYLRNKLVRLLHPGGRAQKMEYVLQISFSEGRTDLDVQQSAIATRANLTVKVRYDLLSIDSASTIGGGNVSATGGFNIFDSEFQTLIAEQGARERALESAAEQIRIRIATLLNRSLSGEPPQP